MTLPYYDYSKYPAQNAPAQSSNPQTGPLAAEGAPFDYSRYNGPVCFEGGQTFNPSQMRFQNHPQNQSHQTSMPGPAAPPPYSSYPAAAGGAYVAQPWQGQAPAYEPQVGQLIQVSGQPQPWVVVHIREDGSFCINPQQ